MYCVNGKYFADLYRNKLSGYAQWCEFFAAAPALATAVANVIADPDVRPDGDVVLSAFILGME